MHEMSIAMNIVDIAEQHAKEAGAKRINKIVLEIGSLSGVLTDALQFCFASATKNTMADQAELEIIKQPAIATCERCHHTFETDQMVPTCPQCGEMVFNIKNGKELRIKYINVD